MGKTDATGPPRISALMPEIASRQGWQQQLETHSLFLRWDTLVDATISAHARPVKIVRNVLWVETDNSSWMQHLQFQKTQLLDTLNTAVRCRLEDIRFTLKSTPPQAEQRQQTVSFARPAPEAMATFEQQIAGIEDETIRESLMSLWYQSHSCRRS